MTRTEKLSAPRFSVLMRMSGDDIFLIRRLRPAEDWTVWQIAGSHGDSRHAAHLAHC